MKQLSISWSPQTTPQELHAILRTLAEEYPLHEGAEGDIAVRFAKVDGDKSCQVSRQGQQATIRYGTPAMAARAVGALMAGMVADGQSVEETSPFETFGIMLDCSRNAVMTVDHLKRWLRRLVLLGYNMAMLYTEDTYELPGEEMFGYMRGRYTAEELREIDRYAGQLGVEMIGCLQTLGHLEQIMKWPAYSAVQDTGGVLLVGEEKTYELIDKMLAFWGSAYGSRRIHIGMDETYGLGRGRYLERNGHQNEFDIFNQHLARVTALCEKHGLKPMIWSDMYFYLSSPKHDMYDPEVHVPEEVQTKIPREAQLVYWDYYHDNKEFYANRIQRHREIGFEPIMGSGVWTWGLLWHAQHITEPNATACMEACRETGLKEVFFTMWGDDGGYCDFDSALQGLAYVAEQGYAGGVDDATLEQRFQAVCGASYAAQKLASKLVEGPLHASAVLWDDPLLGMYLSNQIVRQVSLADEVTRYGNLADQLAPSRDDRAAGDINHAYLLARTLSDKVKFAMQLREGYAKKDQQALRAVREQIPALVTLLQELFDSFRTMWLAHNKPFGLEVVQLRVGGQITRYQELATRLDEYLSGKVGDIPELDAQLNPPSGEVPSYGYRNLASGSSIQ